MKRGLLSVKDVDQAVSRVFRVGFRLGAFDPSTPYDKLSMSVVRAPEHLALSLKAAEESITLLSNRANFLPFDRTKVKSVGVIGPAGNQDYEIGNYYGTPARKEGPFTGLKALLGSGVAVAYERGAGFNDPSDADAVARAVALAKRSDVVVFAFGTNLSKFEGRDRRDLNLPGAQEQLLEAVYAANPKVALLLMNAGPLAVNWACRTMSCCDPGGLVSWRGGR